MLYMLKSRFITSLPQDLPEVSPPSYIHKSRRLTLGRKGYVAPDRLVKRLPERIALHVQIKGQPLMPNKAQGRAILNGIPQLPQALYEPGAHLEVFGLRPESLYQGFDVIFTGHMKGGEGVWMLPDKGPLKSGDIILSQSFKIQPEGIIDLSFDPMDDGKWKMTPPGLNNSYPLWAFAGMIKASSLEVQQLFFTLSHHHGLTHITTYKGQDLQDRGLDEHHPAVIQGRTMMLSDKSISAHLSWPQRLKDLNLLGPQTHPLIYQASHVEPAEGEGGWVYFTKIGENK